MICVICRHEELEPGTVTMTLERNHTTLVIKEVPARVCRNCGESYLEEEITVQLLASAEQAVRMGVQVEVREFALAFPT